MGTVLPMQNDALPAPAFDLDAALATERARLAEILDVCDETNCNLATSHREECRCRCSGAGHGLERQAQEDASRARRRHITATRGAFAGLPVPAADDTEPRKVAAYVIHLDDDEVW
jgi:hypothetical protein